MNDGHEFVTPWLDGGRATVTHCTVYQRVLFHMVNPDDAQAVFHDVTALMASFGYAVGSDPVTDRQYPTLAHTRRLCRHPGRLDAMVDVSGRGVTVQFFRPGGQHEQQKGLAFSYGQKLRWLWTAAKLVALATGGAFSGGLACRLVAKREFWRGDDPLGAFNDGWGHDRFQRGPDGWPSDKELASWSRLDRDGQVVRNGDVRYVQCGGRWVRCRVYGGINGMWHCQGEGNVYLNNVNVARLASVFPGRGRQFMPHERLTIIKRRLESAASDKKYLLAHRLQQALAGVEESVKKLFHVEQVA